MAIRLGGPAAGTAPVSAAEGRSEGRPGLVGAQ